MSRPLEVLFPVDFSELDSRAIPWVAQLVDTFESRLTLLHVRAPNEDARLSEERLESFFAEAHRYPHCDRLVMEGSLVEAVTQRCAQRPVDLLVMPASEPVWIPRLGHNSSRLSLLAKTRVPLWTIAPQLHPGRLHTPMRNVACWVDLLQSEHPQLAAAAQFARALRAQLHVLCALPEVTVPVALDESIPLRAETAAETLLAAVNDETLNPRVWVAEQDDASERRDLFFRSNADILFVAEPERPLLEWFGARPHWFHEASMPLVFIPSERKSPWQLHARRRGPRPAPELLRKAG